jgi:hypothetical protein
MPTTEKVKFPCTACGREFTWKPEIAGKRAKCKCGAVITVPKTRPTPPEDDLPPIPEEFEMEGAADDVAPPPPPPPPPLPASIAVGAVKSKLPLGGGGDDHDNWKWWYYVLAGVAMVPVAFYQYFRLLDYEKGEESRLNLKSFERFLYGIAGKWGVCGFIVFIGAICIAIGLNKYRKQRAAA